MKAAMDRKTTPHTWILGFIAVLFSIASAFSYFGQIEQGIIVGALLGLPGREADVAVAQHRGEYWVAATLFCLTGSIVTAALPLPFYSDASPVSRFIARFVLASIFSVALTVFIGVVAFPIITAIYRGVVH